MIRMRTFESLVEKRPKSIAIDRWIGPNGFFSDKENIEIPRLL